MCDTGTPTPNISDPSLIPSDPAYVLIVLFGFCVHHAGDCIYLFCFVLFYDYYSWVVNGIEYMFAGSNNLVYIGYRRWM